MKRTYYLAKHFFKVFTAYKINFLSILIIPIFGIVYQQSGSIFEQVNRDEYFHYIAIWLAYMSTMAGFTIGHQIVLIREQQFLKQMKFVARDHKLVIYAVALVQLFILILTVTILSATSSLLFNMPFIELLVYSYGVTLVPFVPISLLFVLFNLFHIHAENLQSIITVTTAAMLFFTNFIYLTESVSTISIIINPMNFALEAGKLWGTIFLPDLSINYMGVTLAGILYSCIGIYSLKKTRITPNFRI